MGGNKNRDKSFQQFHADHKTAGSESHILENIGSTGIAVITDFADIDMVKISGNQTGIKNTAGKISHDSIKQVFHNVIIPLLSGRSDCGLFCRILFGCDLFQQSYDIGCGMRFGKVLLGVYHSISNLFIFH